MACAMQAVAAGGRCRNGTSPMGLRKLLQSWSIRPSVSLAATGKTTRKRGGSVRRRLASAHEPAFAAHVEDTNGTRLSVGVATPPALDDGADEDAAKSGHGWPSDGTD